MEAKFKVEMKKDIEVLKDFISFTYRAQGQMPRYKMRVLAIGLVVIGYLAARDGKTIAGAIIGGVGLVFLVASFFVSQIAVGKLKKADIAYQNQTKLTYMFLNGGMHVYEDDEPKWNHSYNDVSCFYGDERNYYLGVNNEDLYLLPRKAFVEGSEAEFMEFIERKSGEQYEFLPLTVKNKWMLHRFNAKQKEMEFNAKAAELRALDREKKAQRKKEKQDKKKK